MEPKHKTYNFVLKCLLESDPLENYVADAMKNFLIKKL